MYIYTIIFDIEKLSFSKRNEFKKFKDVIINCNNLIIKKYNFGDIIKIYEETMIDDSIKFREVIYKKIISNYERHDILVKLQNINIITKTSKLEEEAVIYFFLEHTMDFPYGLIDFNKVLIFSKNIDQLFYLINLIENTNINLSSFIGKKILFI